MPKAAVNDMQKVLPAWNNSIAGNYRYGTATVGGQRYAVIRNGDAVERVRVITPAGNPVVWQSPEPLTDKAMAVISAATYENPDMDLEMAKLREDPSDLKRHDSEWRAGYQAGLDDAPIPPDASPLWRDGYEQGQRDS